MKAAVYRGPGNIRIEERPEPEIKDATDAIIRITHTAICGSDLWFYRGVEEQEEGAPVGHEPMGIVEVVGEEVTFRAGERTKWHTHDGVQILYVTHGEGIVATRDEELTVAEGDLVVFSPGEEHWHGNEPDAKSPFSHISFIAQPEEAGPTVLE